MKSNVLDQHQIDATLLLLGGGKGVRMSGNKLYLEIDGAPLIEQIMCELAPIFKETLLLVARGEKEPVTEKLGSLLFEHAVQVVEDERIAIGPLEGLRSGLEKMSQNWGFLVRCDMPSVQKNLVFFMSSFRAEGVDVIAAERSGYIEPLHAFYSKSSLPSIKKSISNRQKKIKFFYRDINLFLIKEELLKLHGNVEKSFFNLNYPADVLQMKKMAL